jgi:hypothetical protein
MFDKCLHGFENFSRSQGEISGEMRRFLPLTLLAPQRSPESIFQLPAYPLE